MCLNGPDSMRLMPILVKSVACVVAGVACLAGVLLWAWHRDGAISTEIVIDSPPEAVWKVLTASADYPSWNPEITRLSGALRAGSVIEFVDGAGPDAMVFHPIVLTVQPARMLSWKGYVWIPGIFDGEHRFVLEPQGGKTRFVQSETFSGVLAGKLTDGVLAGTAAGMRAMNRALKVRVEAAAKSTPQ
jgi:hypothetical protein